MNELAIKQLGRNGSVVFIIDEAQNLTLKPLENLRLLSNLETAKNKLVQIVLSGQPELNEKLNLPEMRQLSQRINMKRYIKPFSETETYEYIRHRLKAAGCEDSTIMEGESMHLVWQYSRGIPRRINVLCDNAFLIGYALGHKKIKRKVVAEAIEDIKPRVDNTLHLEQELLEEALSNDLELYTSKRRPIYRIATALISVLFIIFLFFF